MKANTNSLIYVIVDKDNNIIKPICSGTYVFFNKKSRDKQLNDEVGRKLWIHNGINVDELRGKTFRLQEVE